MPNSIITLQVGQCGNQLGMAFWKRMCQEHGIGQMGQLIAEDQKGADRKELFFNEANYGKRYVPRAVLVDLEPRVLNEITSFTDENGLCDFYNPENIFQDPAGGGAGNNWGRGYNQPDEIINPILEVLNREAERTDYMEGLAMCHSIMGGTGSGLGSRLLREVYDNFPKKIVQTYTVYSPLYPDVNVAPYNIVLSLEAISDYCDLALLFDNDAFHRLTKDTAGGGHGIGRFNSSDGAADKKNYAQINSMMSEIMAGLSAPMRYYSPIYSRLMHVAACLNPMPPMQFVQPAFAPFANNSSTGNAVQQLIIYPDAKPVLSRITDLNQLITSSYLILNKIADERRERLNAKTTLTKSVSLDILAQQNQHQLRQRRPSGSQMPPPQLPRRATTVVQNLQSPTVTNVPQPEHCLISGLAILQSDHSSDDSVRELMSGGARQFFGKSRLKGTEYTYPPWMQDASTLQLAHCKLSPYMDHRQQPVRGLLLANHTSVSIAFQRTLQKYVEQRSAGKGGAFMEEYKKEKVVEQMDSARENLDKLIKLYKDATTAEFMDLP